MFRISVVVFCLLTAIYAGYSYVRIVTTGAPDFSVYYGSARSLAAGKSPYHEAQAFTGLGYPPFSLLPYLPLTVIPYRAAQTIFITLSFFTVLSVVAWSYRLARIKVGNWQLIGTAILTFWYFPVKFTLGMGQSNLIALFFLTAGMVLPTGHRSAAALALSVIMKPHFLLLVPFVYLAGKKREIKEAFLILILVIFGGILLFGWDNYRHYLSTEVPLLSVFRDREIYYNQGLGAFFSRLFPVASAWNLTVVFSVLVYAASLFLAASRKPQLSFYLGISALLLIEPLSWQHHFVFLIPSYIYFLPRVLRKERIGILVAISFFLTAANIRHPEIWSLRPFSGLILSHVFFGSVLIWGILAADACRFKYADN